MLFRSGIFDPLAGVFGFIIFGVVLVVPGKRVFVEDFLVVFVGSNFLLVGDRVDGLWIVLFGTALGTTTPEKELKEVLETGFGPFFENHTPNAHKQKDIEDEGRECLGYQYVEFFA